VYVHSHEDWVAVGCLYKEQPLKPSILDGFSADRTLEPARPRVNYTSAEDTLVLEDESGRVVLQPARGFELGFRRLRDAAVTGVVVAAKGRVLETGELAVVDVVFPSLTSAASAQAAAASPGSGALPLPLFAPLPPAAPGEAPLFLLLASGISPVACRAQSPRALLALQLFADFVTGMSGGAADEASSAGKEADAVARIVRLVVAGGALASGASSSSIAATTRLLGDGHRSAQAATLGSLASTASAAASPASASASATSNASASFNGRRGGGPFAPAEDNVTVDGLRESDAALATLASALPVDLMPGVGDPATQLLPQQPLHPCLLPLSARFSSLRRVPNPHAAEVAGVQILGSSGQPVLDICKYVSASDLNLDAVSGRRRKRVADAEPAEEAEWIEQDGEEVTAVASVMDTEIGSGAKPSAAGPAGDGSDVLSALSFVDILCNTLEWRHLAPTCPDTLPGYPFQAEDPFTIAAVPHLFFAGAAPAFATKLKTDLTGHVRTRVVAVPDFASTSTAVLVNLRSPTLEPQPVFFGTL
jgi:hypothetical protein